MGIDTSAAVNTNIQDRVRQAVEKSGDAMKATNANIQNRVRQAVEKSGLSRKELELEERRRERKENMNPPDNQPFSQLACAVIYSVAKNWRHTGNPDRDKIANRHVVDFFTGPDYLFWRNFTAIKVDGVDIAAALAENGGLRLPFQIVHADWGSERGAV